MPLILEREVQKRQAEKKAKEEAARREYLRRVNALKSEIAELENSKTQYTTFKSSISVLSSNLETLSKNLEYASEYLSKGMTLDNIGADSGSMRETALQASDYAAKLTSNYQIIEDKIKSIESQISVKRAELARLTM